MATASGAVTTVGSKRRASTDSESHTEDGDTISSNSQSQNKDAKGPVVRKKKIRRARKSSYAIRKVRPSHCLVITGAVAVARV